MKKFLSWIICAFFVLNCANASIIDIIQNVDGTYDIFSDGEPFGSKLSQANAEKVASKLGKGGNTINWKTWVGGGTGSVPPNGTTPKQLTGPANQKLLPAPENNTPQKLLPAPENNTPKPKVNVANVVSKVMSGAEVVGGAYMVYDSGSETSKKVGVTNVLEGAGGGAMIASGLIGLNVIPVGGQIAYGTALAAGAVLGAANAGSRMFSESDCEMDPVTNRWTCCNVSKMTRLDNAVFAKIGEYMFCDFPNVSQCRQGNKPYESDWITARFLDDAWAPCKRGLCSGYSMPEDGNYKIQRYGKNVGGKYCWAWECASPGMVRKGGKCVSSTANCTLKNGTKLQEKQKLSTVLTSVAQCKTYTDNILETQNGTKFEVECQPGGGAVCKAIECKKGFKPTDGKCIGNTTPVCTERYGCASLSGAEKENCIGCCKVASSVAIWDTSAHVCNCANPAHTFNAKTLQCVGAGTDSETDDNKVITESCTLIDGTALQVGETRIGLTATGCMQFTENITDAEHGSEFVLECPSANGARCRAVACVNGGTVGDDGVCKYETNADSSDAKLVECDASIFAQLDAWQIQYSSELDIVNAINIMRDYCRDPNRTQEGINEHMYNLRIKIDDFNKQKELKATENRVRDVKKQLSEIESGFKASVWKTAEGNFNGTRLTSDTIAGVALGTVGGLITSKVIKKNQVKSGFEKIQCTIGGQKVADWGDDFQVGIKVNNY